MQIKLQNTGVSRLSNRILFIPIHDHSMCYQFSTVRTVLAQLTAVAAPVPKNLKEMGGGEILT